MPQMRKIALNTTGMRHHLPSNDGKDWADILDVAVYMICMQGFIQDFTLEGGHFFGG